MSFKNARRASYADGALYADARDVASIGHYFDSIQVMTARTTADCFDGLFFAARDVCYHENDSCVHFSLDMAAAYPDEAHVCRYAREFLFDRRENVLHVTDSAVFSECEQPICIPLLCARWPIVLKNTIRIGKVILTYDPKQYAVSMEKRKLEDAALVRKWGGRTYVWRLLLTRHEIKLSDTNTITFRLAKW